MLWKLNKYMPRCRMRKRQLLISSEAECRVLPYYPKTAWFRKALFIFSSAICGVSISAWPLSYCNDLRVTFPNLFSVEIHDGAMLCYNHSRPYLGSVTPLTPDGVWDIGGLSWRRFHLTDGADWTLIVPLIFFIAISGFPVVFCIMTSRRQKAGQVPYGQKSRPCQGKLGQ